MRIGCHTRKENGRADHVEQLMRSALNKAAHNGDCEKCRRDPHHREGLSTESDARHRKQRRNSYKTGDTGNTEKHGCIDPPLEHQSPSKSGNENRHGQRDRTNGLNNHDRRKSKGQDTGGDGDDHDRGTQQPPAGPEEPEECANAEALGLMRGSDTGVLHGCSNSKAYSRYQCEP